VLLGEPRENRSMADQRVDLHAALGSVLFFVVAPAP
jgi:hypothetical protein